MIAIDPKKTKVIDLSTFDEVVGAVAIDRDINTVRISTPTYGGGETLAIRQFPQGFRVMRR